MIKHLLQLCTLTTVVILLAGNEGPGQEEATPPWTQASLGTASLHQGMTMSDVQHALGCQGNIWKVERIQGTESGDPLAWDVEWQISCIYLSNSTEPDRVASFGAWDTKASSDRPPDSAFRLVSWKSVG